MGSTSASRLPSTVQVTSSVTTGAVTSTSVMQPASPVPLRKQVFHPGQVNTAEAIARTLNTMQAEIHSGTLPARTNLRNQAITFEGLVFDAGFPNVSINHGLNSKVRWSVVRWYNTTTTAGIYEPTGSQSNPSVLVLKPAAGIGGTADIEVWSAG